MTRKEHIEHQAKCLRMHPQMGRDDLIVMAEWADANPERNTTLSVRLSSMSKEVCRIHKENQFIKMAAHDLEAKLAIAVEALKFYREPTNWFPNSEYCHKSIDVSDCHRVNNIDTGGNMAWEALAKIEGMK